MTATNKKSKIIIVATQRSGSTMVCDDLRGTGQLGWPTEIYDNLMNKEPLSAEELFSAYSEQINHVTTANNICAFKIMANQLSYIDALHHKINALTPKKYSNYELIKKTYADAIWVKIERKEKVRQAISRLLAVHTDTYHLAENNKNLKDIGKLISDKRQLDHSKVCYSFSAIEHEIENINSEGAILDEFFSAIGESPITVNYETAIHDRSYITDIAEQLNLSNVIVSERNLMPLSNDTNEKWFERYNQELSR